MAATKTWPELTLESWMFGADMAAVIWLRSLRLMTGGKMADREAQRMVSEKLAANAMFGWASMMRGVQTAQESTGHALAHYGKPVRANRRRLSRRR